MCVEIRHISSNLPKMSSRSISIAPNSPVEEEEADKGSEVFELQETAPSETAEKPAEDDPENEKPQKGKGPIATASKILASSSSSELLPQALVSGDDDDDEGFMTPTSMDHKIPAVTQCPPAPMKPRPAASTSLKRKASPPPPHGPRRSSQLGDSTAEFESIFRPLSDQQENDVDDEQECKRAKNEDHEDLD